MPPPNDAPEKAGWRIKKEISVGDLVAILMAAAGIVTAYFTLDKRVALLEDRIVRQNEIDRSQDMTTKEALQGMRDELRAVSAKLDRLIERRH
jgi:hypothetical protein